VTMPCTLAGVREREVALHQFGEESPEFAQMAASDHHRVANARKAFSGQFQGLLDPGIMTAKAAAEAELMTTKTTDAPEAFVKAQEGFVQIADAQKAVRSFEREWALLERGDAFFSDLFTIPLHLFRLPVESTKPSAERLREYRDSNLESLKFQLFSPAPIHADLERAKLAASLTFLAEKLGGEHPVVVKILAGKSPANRAAELIAGTTLA